MGWLFFAVATYFIGRLIWHIVVFYRASTGTIKERLLATAKESRTIIVAYATIIGGYALWALDQAAQALQSDSAQQFIRENLDPKYVGAAFMAIGIIVWLARLKGMFQVSQFGFAAVKNPQDGTTMFDAKPPTPPIQDKG